MRGRLVRVASAALSKRNIADFVLGPQVLIGATFVFGAPRDAQVGMDELHR